MLYKPAVLTMTGLGQSINLSLTVFFTIAGRNPSFLGATCLILLLEMLHCSSYWLGYTFPFASSGNTREEKQRSPSGINLI